MVPPRRLVPIRKRETCLKRRTNVSAAHLVAALIRPPRLARSR